MKGLPYSGQPKYILQLSQLAAPTVPCKALASNCKTLGRALLLDWVEAWRIKVTLIRLDTLDNQKFLPNAIKCFACDK